MTSVQGLAQSRLSEKLSYDKRRRPVEGSKEEEELLYIAGQYSLIQEAWGGPLGITSGYRPEPINTRVGGAPGSYHSKGMALDIYPVGESCAVFYKWLARRWTGGLGDGCNKGLCISTPEAMGSFSQGRGQAQRDLVLLMKDDDTRLVFELTPDEVAQIASIRRVSFQELAWVSRSRERRAGKALAPAPNHEDGDDGCCLPAKISLVDASRRSCLV